MFAGPGGLEKLRKSCRLNFHLFSSRSELMLPSYNQKTNMLTTTKWRLLSLECRHSGMIFYNIALCLWGRRSPSLSTAPTKQIVNYIPFFKWYLLLIRNRALICLDVSDVPYFPKCFLRFPYPKVKKIQILAKLYLLLIQNLECIWLRTHLNSNSSFSR